MAPRTVVEDGRLTFQTGPVAITDVLRLDAGARGDAPPARTAIWLDEHRGGVSIRIVDLATSRVVFAQNIDPGLTETRNTERMYTLSAELERRARGDSLTQSFVDVAVYPGQHISLDWTDQWGPTNANLSGVTLSLFDPIVGIGAAHTTDGCPSSTSSWAARPSSVFPPPSPGASARTQVTSSTPS